MPSSASPPARSVGSGLKPSNNSALATPGTPVGDEALVRYGELCLRFHAEGEKAGLEEARRAFAELKEKSHSRWGLRGRVGLARVAAAEGRREEAIKDLNGFLSNQGKDDAFIEAAYFLGGLHAEAKDDLGQLRSASKALTYALQLWEPQKAYYSGSLTGDDIRGKLGWVMQRIREIETGEPKLTFERAVGAMGAQKYAEAISLFEKVVTGHPQHTLSNLSGLRICECLRLKGDQETAIKKARAFIAQSGSGPYRGQAHLLIGDILLEHEFNSEAAEHEYAGVLWPQGYDAATGKTQRPAGESLNEAPPDEVWETVLADGHERYGLCLYLRREFDQAAKHFAEELRLRPSRPFGKGQIVSHMQCLLQMCRDKKYPVYHHQHVMNGDRRVQTLLFLASAYAEVGRHEKALAMFQRVQGEEFKRSASDLQRAYARMEEAECCRLLLRDSDAIKMLGDFDEKYAAAPFAPMALMEKARIYLTLDDKSSAQKVYNQIFARYPSSQEAAQALYLAGYVHYVMKEWKDALAYFDLLASRYPASKYAEMVKAQEIPAARAALAAQSRS